MSPLLQPAVPHPRANHRPRSPETSPIIIILQARFVHSVRLGVLDSSFLLKRPLNAEADLVLMGRPMLASGIHVYLVTAGTP
jgi:hypothetical protein